jgi:predicted dehydrogenase
MVIATPVSTHYKLARQALDAGKSVSVEKPLAMSRREASDLLWLALGPGGS